MIVQNAAICKLCDDYIFSKHRHDFVTCACGSISVDGGQSYCRRVGNPENIIECSWEIPDEAYIACAEAVYEALERDCNNYGIANAVMRVLRSHDRIIADHEQRIMAHNKNLDEVMVVEVDGTVNRYRKVV